MPDELEPHDQHRVPTSASVVAQRSTIASSWIAPLPPPNVLRAYNDAFPGCAERIVAMAESESVHRQQQDRFDGETERLIISGELRSEARGTWLAFVLAIFVISVSASLIYCGFLAWGVGLLSVELISLVSLFIYGRNARRATPPAQPQSQQTTLPFPE